MWEGVFGFHGASDLHFQEELLILFLYFSTQEISNTLYCSRFPLWGSRVKTFLASRSTSLYWSHTRATCETKLWRGIKGPDTANWRKDRGHRLYCHLGVTGEREKRCHWCPSAHDRTGAATSLPSLWLDRTEFTWTQCMGNEFIWGICPPPLNFSF